MSYPLPPHLAARLPAEVTDALNRGQSVIPIGVDKKPLVKWKPYQWQQPGANELSYWLHSFGHQIKAWARITGQMAGAIVLDDDGAGWLARWGLSSHVATRNGFHWIGRHPGWRVGTVNSRSCRRLAETFPGLDIRGDGGYSLIWRFDGRYRWLRDPEPDPLDALPLDVRAFFGLIEPPRSPRERALPVARRISHDGDRPAVSLLVGRAVAEARASGRNNGGLWLAQQARDNGYSRAEAEAAGSEYLARLWGTNTKGELEPYGEEDFRATVAGVYSQGAREPWERREGRRVTWIDPTRPRPPAATEWLPSRPAGGTR